MRIFSYKMYVVNLYLNKMIDYFLVIEEEEDLKLTALFFFLLLDLIIVLLLSNSNPFCADDFLLLESKLISFDPFLLEAKPDCLSSTFST